MINGILLVLLLILLGGLKFNFASIKGRVGEAKDVATIRSVGIQSKLAQKLQKQFS